MLHLDSRNPGGRQAIIERMLKHQKNLRDIQSTYGHNRDPKTKKKKKRQPVDKAMIGIDCAPPRSVAMSRKISTLRAQRQAKELAEHQRRLNESQRRMQQYPTAQQRQKNPFDPVAHPAVLVRYTKPHTDHEFAWDAPTRGKQLFVSNPFDEKDLRPLKDQPETMVSLRKQQSQRTLHRTTAPATSSTTSRPRPKSAAPARQRSRMFQQDHRTSPSPSHAGSGSRAFLEQDPYTKLKLHLFELIVQHRIFKERDLQTLFEKARRLNTHLDQARVDLLIEELCEELGVVPPHHMSPEARAKAQQEIEQALRDESSGEANTRGKKKPIKKKKKKKASTTTRTTRPVTAARKKKTVLKRPTSAIQRKQVAPETGTKTQQPPSNTDGSGGGGGDDDGFEI